MSSNLYEQISQTARDFAHSYDETKCKQDISALSATLTRSCRRYYAPTSLLTQAPALQEGQSNQQYEAQSQIEFTSIFTTWTVEIVDLTVDVYAKKAVVRSINRATSRQGKTYPFDNTFTLFLTEDGKQVEKIVQFVDVGVAAQLMQDSAELSQALR